MNLLRRFRAALALGLVWGIGWGLIAVAVGVLERVNRLLDNPSYLPQFLSGLLGAFLVAVTMGVVCGGIFSLFLAFKERNTQVRGLSQPVVAAGGAVAGALLYLLLVGIGFARGPEQLSFFSLLAGGSMFGVLGAASSAGTLAVARRAPALPTETERQELTS